MSGLVRVAAIGFRSTTPLFHTAGGNSSPSSPSNIFVRNLQQNGGRSIATSAQKMTLLEQSYKILAGLKERRTALELTMLFYEKARINPHSHTTINPHDRNAVLECRIRELTTALADVSLDISIVTEGLDTPPPKSVKV